MATIANVTISVGTSGEKFQVSNPGWTLVEVNPPFGFEDLRVSNVGGVNTVFNDSTDMSGVLYRNETPADKNQSVTLRIRRRTAEVGTYWHAIARLNGNNFLYAVFSGDANKPVTLGKCVGGTRTQLGSTSTDNSRLSTDGSEGDLTLEVTGTSARVLWNGVQVIAPQSFSEPVLDTVGRVAFAHRTFADDSQSTSYHVSRFTALDGVGADTTAPTLTSPTGTQTGSTTASGTVSTNEGNGTLYRLASTNATETAATVKAAALTQAVSATGVQAVTFSGLTPSTAYYAHYVHRDAAGNDSAVASSASFTTAAAGDVTPPTLSAPSATATGTSTATGSVTTNEANGTLYRYASTNASESAATIKAAALTQAVSSTGAQAVSFTGLSSGVTYYAHFVHRDAAGNDSAVASSAAFTTTAVGATLTSQPLRRNSTTLSGATTLSWCAIHNESTGAFVALKTGVTVNSSSVFSVSDAALVAGTEYRLTWREAGGQKGTASVVAA